MQSVLTIILAIVFLNFPQDTTKEYLNQKIKGLEIRGTLISKRKANNTYIFEVKSNKDDTTLSIKLPASVTNSREIYDFVFPGDYFIKVKDELKIRLGHKFDGNIEVKHFSLYSDDK